MSKYQVMRCALVSDHDEHDYYLSWGTFHCPGGVLGPPPLTLNDRLAIDAFSRKYYDIIRSDRGIDNHGVGNAWDTARGNQFEVLLGEGRIVRVTIELDRVMPADG